MPFTLSHPAAVLPLLRVAGERGPLVASALVAGSMAPDVPFFAESLFPGVYGRGRLTHRWWAVPTVDVAIAGTVNGPGRSGSPRSGDRPGAGGVRPTAVRRSGGGRAPRSGPSAPAPADRRSR
ncbi:MULTISPECIES: DUF4184 family protein [unclassified Kitasatospora]|uniref:DUF4184 family protein n=1 Tax=unclassified Kitasatospora TaxID=2633591 RepID=UPI0038048094